MMTRRLRNEVRTSVEGTSGLTTTPKTRPGCLGRSWCSYRPPPDTRGGLWSCATAARDASSPGKTLTGATPADLGGGAAAAVAGTAGRRGRGRRTSTPPSSLPVRCAAFYGGFCEHELQTVTKGVRLCLLYNLVWTTPGPQPVAAVGQSGSAVQLRLSDAVAAWCRPISSCNAAKFIVPLAHEYTKASLSFSGLKGRDRAMADSLRACRDLDLYLVTIVKHENRMPWDDSFDRSCDRRRGTTTVSTSPDGYEGEGYAYGCGGGDGFEDGIYRDHGGYVSDDPEDKEMCELYQTTIAAEDWVDGEDDSECSDLDININGHEVLGYLPLEDPDESAEESDDDDDDGCDSADAKGLDLLFPADTEATERAYQGYTGNCSPTLDFWYQRAALIFWPSSAKMRVELENGPSSALRVARERSSEYGDAGELPLADLAMIVSLAETKREKPHRQGYYYPSAPPPGHVFITDARDTADVLALCSRAGAAALDSSRRLLRLLAGGTSGAVETPGLVSEGVSRGVAALVRAVGWQAIGGDVLRLVEACSLEQAGNVAVLDEKLLSLPRQQQPELEQDVAGVKLLRSKRRSSLRLRTVLMSRLRSKRRSSLCFRTMLAMSCLRSKLCSSLGLSKTALDLGAAAIKTFAEDVLWLAASVNGAGGLEQGFVGAMVMGTRSGNSTQICEGQEKLKAVLESKAVQAAVRGGGGAGSSTDGSQVFWRALVSERLVNLEAQAPPELCWRQPNAVFTKDPQIQHFLRGPESTMIYRGTPGSPFTSLDQARVCSYSFYGVHAKAVARVDGRRALVEITKTVDLHEERVKAHAEV
ncbi:conserved unknown protein [Ectocarpus siliculosus]|uniref:Uncharacterized protein n=1 Tax=Ectocarpus siliculosus TaxID=2880 RepID=D7FJ35_ECTSI|nr:conserved unknown protein [Ectocarpus siliculosus]|eukprot:CBJ49074.1 conserved unknown protein [Ectocarpus siliculosus]